MTVEMGLGEGVVLAGLTVSSSSIWGMEVEASKNEAGGGVENLNLGNSSRAGENVVLSSSSGNRKKNSARYKKKRLFDRKRKALSIILHLSCGY